MAKEVVCTRHGTRTEGPCPQCVQETLSEFVRPSTPVKLDVTREWCLAAAQREGNQEIGAGLVDLSSDLAKEALLTADVIKKLDGDRDWDAASNLTVEMALGIGNLLRSLADTLSRNRSDG